jgi:hypothetical protein
MNVKTLDQQETLSPFDRRKFLSTLLAGAGGAALQMSGGNALAALAPTAKAVSPTHDYFYGMNGHLAWTNGLLSLVSPATQLALLKDLGVTCYRCDVADGGMASILALALDTTFADAGVAILPVINPLSANWDSNSSESAAYQLGYDLAVRCTKPLAGRVRYIECGNELDVSLKTGGDGSNFYNWDAGQWPSFRGVIRGMIDGVKSVDSSINCGVNVGIPLAYGALQMLWNGITPNGTASGRSGASYLRWDFTTYHWYHSSGDIQCGWKDGACVDVLQILKDSFGKPIWLTEWGWTGGKDYGQDAADYVTTALTQYRALKDKYDIQSVMMYSLIDSRYGLIKPGDMVKNPAYSAFKNFVAANPT